jgi:hypothetical protein
MVTWMEKYGRSLRSGRHGLHGIIGPMVARTVPSFLSSRGNDILSGSDFKSIPAAATDARNRIASDCLREATDRTPAAYLPPKDQPRKKAMMRQLNQL